MIQLDGSGVGQGPKAPTTVAVHGRMTVGTEKIMLATLSYNLQYPSRLQFLKK